MGPMEKKRMTPRPTPDQWKYIRLLSRVLGAGEPLSDGRPTRVWADRRIRDLRAQCEHNDIPWHLWRRDGVRTDVDLSVLMSAAERQQRGRAVWELERARVRGNERNAR